MAKPYINDWYEAVKINYGIRPDGSKDFQELPADYATKSILEHYAFSLAEVYNPQGYSNYIKCGKMDYLCDKVELYDKLK